MPHNIPTTSASVPITNMCDDLDEYTALQKYISTYRDPKLAQQEAGDQQEAKPKKAWQVC